MLIDDLLQFSSHEDVVRGILAAQAFLTFCYLVSAMFLRTNDYAGFIAVFTGFIFSGSIGFTYYGITHLISRTMYGTILGYSMVLTLISLQSSIFWGQYSSCDVLPKNFQLDDSVKGKP